jgi:Rrf2 family protein
MNGRGMGKLSRPLSNYAKVGQFPLSFRSRRLKIDHGPQMRKITNLVTFRGGMSVFTLGRQTDYAARIVLHLSCLEPGARVTAAQISEMRLIPAAFIKRIISRLSAVGVVTTVRGSKGGLTLARRPSEISLLEVVEAFEGPLSLNVCVEKPGECPLSEKCPVQRSWVGATANLSEYLRGVRFDALATSLSKGGPPRAAHGGHGFVQIKGGS